MRIESSQIRLSANHSFSASDRREESLDATAGFTSRQAFSPSTPAGRPASIRTTHVDSVALSREARAAFESRESSRTIGQSRIRTPETEYSLSNERASTAGSIIDGAMNREVVASSGSRLEADPGSPVAPSIFNAAGADEGMESSSLEVALHSRETRHEEQGVRVNASGMVKTGDGREIDFSLHLEMEREFTSVREETARLSMEHRVEREARDAAELVDPLVLDFEGKAPELTDSKFAFDLDSDGREENISFLAPGSGFLALDRNADGVINDGRELFGARTGDGFRELAAYDEDHNQWIDENDAVFDKLSVWTRNAPGADRLTSLREMSVGAIYLGNVDSRFDFRDGENNLDGRLRRSGVYLDENGAAKTIQQIDLAIDPGDETAPGENANPGEPPETRALPLSGDDDKIRKQARLAVRANAASDAMDRALDAMRRQNEAHGRMRREREEKKRQAEHAADKPGRSPVLEMLSRVLGKRV